MGRFESFTPPTLGSELSTSEITMLEEITSLSNSSTGQFIRKEGGSLINSTLSETITFDGLSDVAISSPLSGHVISYNGSSWVNSTTGAGSVTSVSVVTSNGVSGTVEDENTTPAITLTLGAITPSSVNISGLTASELVATDGSKNLQSLAVATYPSLTELTYVKGVTSAIQTQIDAKGTLSNVVEDTTPQLGGDLDLNGNNIDFPTTANISDVLDEDTMVSDSPTKLATQQSIKAYVDSQVGGANTALDNLASVALNTALLPDAAAADDFGSATLPFKDLFFAGSSATPGTNNFKITGASTSGTRTMTFPDVTGTVVTSGNPEDLGGVLQDLDTLGAAASDGQFIVATGSGAFAYESGSTARDSLSLGTSDSPQFTGIELGHATDTTIARSSAGVITVEGSEVTTLGNTTTGTGSIVRGTSPTIGGTLTYTNAGAGTDPTFASNSASQLLSLTGDLDISGALTLGTVLAGAEGGTGNGFFAVSGPTTSLKTFTFPDASATVLTDNATVTVAQGGTGASTLTDGGVLLGSGTGAITAMAALADGEMIVGDGTTDPVAESGATLRTSIGVGTGDSPQFTGIELGHATDSTITRVSAGVLAVEGNNIITADIIASTTVSGVVELATAAETTTGTDTGRAVTPDGLAGSDYGIRIIEVLVEAGETSLATGDSLNGNFVAIPAELDGYNLVSVGATVFAAGTTGTTDIQINNHTDTADMLSTKITIDTGETDSSTAATPPAIDGTADDVVEGDVLTIDVDAVSTGTAPKGLVVRMGFQKP